MATSTITQEPEEAIEAALVTKLTTACAIPVEGVLTPATTGTEKRLSADTFIGVNVSHESQDLDFIGPNMPETFTADVVVHYAQTDDPDLSEMQSVCRAVRTVINSLSGDGCANLGASGFACDFFQLGKTSKSFEGGENPTYTKAYAVTLKGRTTYSDTTTTETEAE